MTAIPTPPQDTVPTSTPITEPVAVPEALETASPAATAVADADPVASPAAVATGGGADPDDTAGAAEGDDLAAEAADAADDGDAPATASGQTPSRKAPIDHAAVAAALKARFPALFGGGAKPVKLRVQVDIQAAAPGEFTKPALSAFLRRHTGSTSYLLALVKSPHRFDLDGQPAGEISDEHRQVAQDELDRRRTLVQDRRELEAQQRRNRAALLRDFETTTLTRPNFCALKDVPEDKLDGLLEIARAEAAEDAAAPRGFDRRPPGRNDRGGERGDRPGRPGGRSGPRSDAPRGAARPPRGPRT
jgi:ProP effector